MVNTYRFAALTSLFIQLAFVAAGQPAHAQQPAQQSAGSTITCPAALDRAETHTVSASETLSSIATRYQLQPQTLANFNPGVSSAPTPGTSLRIPPFSGTVVTPAAADSWQSLAERYGARADVLFEINGCQADLPSQIFIPSATPVAAATTATAGQNVSHSKAQLPGYPLAQPAEIVLSYGWQPSATQEEVVFNNGIAFAVDSPLQVQAVDSGTVAFVGRREGYGLLLVINHTQGVQTRYANLSDISVVVGQSVTTDMAVGTVGSSGATNVRETTGGNDATYLYFELRTNSDDGWIAQDPGQYLPALELR